MSWDLLRYIVYNWSTWMRACNFPCMLVHIFFSAEHFRWGKVTLLGLVFLKCMHGRYRNTNLVAKETVGEEHDFFNFSSSAGNLSVILILTPWWGVCTSRGRSQHEYSIYIIMAIWSINSCLPSPVEWLGWSF